MTTFASRFCLTLALAMALFAGSAVEIREPLWVPVCLAASAACFAALSVELRRATKPTAEPADSPEPEDARPVRQP